MSDESSLLRALQIPVAAPPCLHLHFRPAHPATVPGESSFCSGPPTCPGSAVPAGSHLHGLCTVSEGGSREGGDLGGVGTGTLVSSDPQGLLGAAEKLDPAGGVCVCADQEGCVLLCCGSRSDSWRGMGCEFRGIWKVTSCVSLESISRAGRGRKGAGVKPLKSLTELTARCNKLLFLEY